MIAGEQINWLLASAAKTLSLVKIIFFPLLHQSLNMRKDWRRKLNYAPVSQATTKLNIYLSNDTSFPLSRADNWNLRSLPVAAELTSCKKAAGMEERENLLFSKLFWKTTTLGQWLRADSRESRKRRWVFKFLRNEKTELSIIFSSLFFFFFFFCSTQRPSVSDRWCCVLYYATLL